MRARARPLELQACAQCAKAKTRCAWDDPPGRKCVRCARLHKSCTNQGTSSPRQSSGPPSRGPSLEASGARQQGSPACEQRFRQLERKIDHLEQRIAGGRTPSDTPAASGDAQTRQQHFHEHALPPSDSWHDGPMMSMSPSAAENHLLFYRRHLEPLFPFVTIPAGSAQDLFPSHPLLLRAVFVAASLGNRAAQHEHGMSLTRLIAHRAFVDGDKSMDMMQALLVHLGFYHGHIAAKSQVANLMQLALALMADLGLNRSAHANDRRKLVFDDSRTSYGFSDGATNGASVEEQRALLGCFYLSSVISATFQHTEPIKYSNIMRNMCEGLARSSCASDQYLGLLVQAQRTTNRIGDTLQLNDALAHGGNSLTASSTHLAIEALLDSVANLDTRDMAQNDPPTRILRLHYKSASIYLHEVCLYDYAWPALGTLVNYRLEAGFKCVQALGEFFAEFLALPHELYFTQPYTIWTQLSYALLIGSRISLIKTPGWPSEHVSSALNYPGILENVIKRLQEASRGEFYETEILNALSGDTTRPRPANDKLLVQTSRKVERIKTWYLRQVGTTSASSNVTRLGDRFGDHPMVDVDSDHIPQARSFGSLDVDLDEAFWSDFIECGFSTDAHT